MWFRNRKNKFIRLILYIIGICFLFLTFGKSKELIISVQHPSEACSTDAEQTFISYCSCKADNRGLHQNVIAFSLYGNFSNPKHFDRYVDPIKATLANISLVYPGSVSV